MKKVPIKIKEGEYPKAFSNLLEDARIYDESCSDAARVIFINKDEGYYLKRSKKGELFNESELTKYFYKKHLGTEVLMYLSEDSDYLLTRRVKGEDATSREYIENPKRLCETLAEILRMLHEKDASDCPFDRRESYIKSIDENYKKGMFDNSLTSFTKKLSREEAYRISCEGKDLMKNDVLIHGDYCLPNIMLDNWKLSSFIDLGNGGKGDRHIDLFWGAWSLWFNTGEEKYGERFLDAYGREKIDFDMIRIISAMECFG